MNGGPAYVLWCIPSQEQLKQMFDDAAPTPEHGADDHFARHLHGDPPLAPYDGSRCRKQIWSKAYDVSHLHRCTCPSCGVVSYTGGWRHHVYVTDLDRCRCQPVGAVADWHIRCPPGCGGRAGEL